MSVRTVATSFEMSALRDLALLGNVRRFVGEMCQHAIDDAEITSRVVVATHEMLDNSLRHGTGEGSHIRVALARSDEDVAVTIDTTNHLDDASAKTLREVLAEIERASDRYGLYLDLLRRVAARNDACWLGLGRVHAEAELGITGRFERGLVHLRAEGRFPLARGSRSST